MASAGHDGVVLWQWLRLPIHCCQTSDPEEVKMALCHDLSFKVTLARFPLHTILIGVLGFYFIIITCIHTCL